jgi:hypothetical protein
LSFTRSLAIRYQNSSLKDFRIIEKRGGNVIGRMTAWQINQLSAKKLSFG